MNEVQLLQAFSDIPDSDIQQALEHPMQRKYAHRSAVRQYLPVAACVAVLLSVAIAGGFLGNVIAGHTRDPRN